MSNYTKTTDFTAKDALASGVPDKLIVGAEIDSEFDAIATAVATKANSADVPTLAGTNTFTGVNEVSSAAPQLRFNETDAGANAKCWSFEVNGAALGLYLRADSFGASGTVPLYFVRSGNALSSIAIDAGGAVTWRVCTPCDATPALGCRNLAIIAVSEVQARNPQARPGISSR